MEYTKGELEDLWGWFFSYYMLLLHEARLLNRSFSVRFSHIYIFAGNHIFCRSIEILPFYFISEFYKKKKQFDTRVHLQDISFFNIFGELCRQYVRTKLNTYYFVF